MMRRGPRLCGLQAVLGAASAARAQRTDALNLATAGTGYGMLCQVRLPSSPAIRRALLPRLRTVAAEAALWHGARTDAFVVAAVARAPAR